MGKKLLQDLAQATGLPDQMVENELSSLVHAAGLTTEEVTLESMREILANYVQDILLAAKLEAQTQEAISATAQETATVTVLPLFPQKR